VSAKDYLIVGQNTVASCLAGLAYWFGAAEAAIQLQKYWNLNTLALFSSLGRVRRLQFHPIVYIIEG